jgi:hypothetical protein
MMVFTNMNEALVTHNLCVSVEAGSDYATAPFVTTSSGTRFMLNNLNGITMFSAGANKISMNDDDTDFYNFGQNYTVVLPHGRIFEERTRVEQGGVGVSIWERDDLGEGLKTSGSSWLAGSGWDTSNAYMFFTNSDVPAGANITHVTLDYYLSGSDAQVGNLAMSWYKRQGFTGGWSVVEGFTYAPFVSSSPDPWNLPATMDANEHMGLGEQHCIIIYTRRYGSLLSYTTKLLGFAVSFTL